MSSRGMAFSSRMFWISVLKTVKFGGCALFKLSVKRMICREQNKDQTRLMSDLPRICAMISKMRMPRARLLTTAASWRTIFSSSSDANCTGTGAVIV